MAQAFPEYTLPSGSTIICRRSSRRGRQRDAAGVADRVGVRCRHGDGIFPGGNYDLVAFFDRLHDMGDPVGAAAHVRAALGAGWHLADRRTFRLTIRLADNLKSRRADLLRRLDDDLHAGLALRRALVWRSARRPVSCDCAKSLPAEASPASAAQWKHRSTWCGSSSLVGEQVPLTEEDLHGDADSPIASSGHRKP